MILDNQSILSDAQAITASAASTNYIALKGEVSFGTPIELLAQVVEDFATCTSVKIGIQTDDNTSFSSATTLVESAAIPVASLKAGYKFKIPKFLPKGNEGYMRAYYTVAGDNATTGKITCGVVMSQEEGHHLA